jgi:protein-L-isoaspartate(D-aspartate) O-methyltransferase
MKDDFETERHRMVAEQIAARGLRDPRLLAAFEAVPRHLFVPIEYRDHAYQDRALEIPAGQTISQPYIVAYMTDLLNLQGDERVLDVGTGSGYQTAILAHLAREIHTIEFIPELAESAKSLLTSLGRTNIHFHIGDGSSGFPEAAPYDGIIVSAAAPAVPKPLLEQLSEGGRLIIPIGPERAEREEQALQVWRRVGDRFESKTVLGVAFVPLRGKYGRK